MGYHKSKSDWENAYKLSFELRNHILETVLNGIHSGCKVPKTFINQDIDMLDKYASNLMFKCENELLLWEKRKNQSK